MRREGKIICMQVKNRRTDVGEGRQEIERGGGGEVERGRGGEEGGESEGVERRGWGGNMEPGYESETRASVTKTLPLINFKASTCYISHPCKSPVTRYSPSRKLAK